MTKKKARNSDIRLRFTKAERESLERKSDGKAAKFAKAVVLKACSKERKGASPSSQAGEQAVAAAPGNKQLPKTKALERVDFQRFISDTINAEESDRGCVLVAAGYIDVALEHSLRLALLIRSPNAESEIDALLSNKFAPIGDLWSRSLLAFSMG